MLVLTRKPGEKLHVGPDIVVTVLEVVGNKIRIGIDAPLDYKVLRAELYNLLEARPAQLGKVAAPSS